MSSTSHPTDWLCEAGWGVFIHYLAAPASGSGGAEISAEQWNQQVESVDVEQLAEQVKSTGAGYLFLTLGQNSGHYCAPNATYDQLVGTQPSKCSRRDLPAELAKALDRYGVRLMVYLPSGAPEFDPVAAQKLQWKRDGGRLANFQVMWERVIREWSLRWGRTVHGWWIDGCYWTDDMYRHPEPPNFRSFAAAMRAGNPGSLVAWNPGVKYPIVGVDEQEDYTAGEVNQPQEIDCPGRWLGRAQFHMLSYLGTTWGRGPLRLSSEQAIEYTRSITDHGGVVSWDVPVQGNGLIPHAFMEQLRAVGRAVAATRLRRAGGFQPAPRWAKLGVDVLESPEIDSEGRPARTGRAQVCISNPWPTAIRGQVRIWAEPAETVRLTGDAMLSFALEPGQTMKSTVTVQAMASPGETEAVLRLQRQIGGNGRSDARIFTYPLPVRQMIALHSLPETGWQELAASLAEEPSRVVTVDGMPLAELRLASMGEDLVVAAHVTDRRMCRSPLIWDGSCIEIFTAIRMNEQISQVFLVPRTDQGPACGARAVGGRGEPEPEIQVQSHPSPTGYFLLARVPLALLRVADHHEFLMEISITGSLAGDILQRATLFGSRNAAGNCQAYARFRREGVR